MRFSRSTKQKGKRAASLDWLKGGGCIRPKRPREKRYSIDLALLCREHFRTLRV